MECQGYVVFNSVLKHNGGLNVINYGCFFSCHTEFSNGVFWQPLLHVFCGTFLSLKFSTLQRTLSLLELSSLHKKAQNRFLLQKDKMSHSMQQNACPTFVPQEQLCSFFFSPQFLFFLTCAEKNTACKQSFNYWSAKNTLPYGSISWD